mgnify:CR=1 FL=1|tara:strand:- start:2452 stop:2661 length:210 start_codon:yes stop_codon:yes gene_type:complete
MKLTENALRSLARRVLKELFTKKNRLSLKGTTDYDIDPYDYSGDGAWDGGGDLGESDDLEEDEELSDES